MSGLREPRKALDWGSGVQITGPAALAEVTRLTARRDALTALSTPARAEKVPGRSKRSWTTSGAATRRRRSAPP